MESEISELDYVEQLLEDFDLSPDDKIATLLDALQDEEAEEEDEAE